MENIIKWIKNQNKLPHFLTISLNKMIFFKKISKYIAIMKLHIDISPSLRMNEIARAGNRCQNKFISKQCKKL